MAPRAREPRVRLFGTLNTASSAIEKMVGITAKPIARPTTRALRWSKVMPRSLVSHWRMSPAKNQFSRWPLMPSDRAPTPMITGISSAASQPSGTRRRMLSGRRLHSQAARMTPSGVSSSRLKMPGRWPSR
ncbi:hypothetical protein D3C78_1589350 [compost metagenome]